MSDLLIDDFDALDTAVMDVVPPGGGAPIGTITFAGPGHEKTKKLSDEATRKRLYEERQRVINNRWKPAEKTPEDAARENCAFIVNRILSWSGAFRRRDPNSGEIVDIPFSEEAGMSLLMDSRKSWLFSQCLEFLTATDSFSPPSAKNS